MTDLALPERHENNRHSSLLHIATNAHAKLAYNRAIVVSYTLLLIVMTLSAGGIARLLIYVLPILIIATKIASTKRRVTFEWAPVQAAGLILVAFALAALANFYVTSSSREYIFALLAPVSLIVTARFDRRFIKELTVGLLVAQALFLLVRFWQGRLDLSFDILNESATDRVASESYVCFPLSAVAMYFGMTRQYRWLLLSIAGVVLGLRRGPLAADIVGLLIAYATDRLPLRKSQIAVACVAVFTVGATVSLYASAILSTLENSLGLSVSMNQLTNGRFEIYEILQQVVMVSEKSFLLGNGPGFNIDFLARAGVGVPPWDHPHNDFLAILLDFGAVGFYLLVQSWIILIGRTRFAIAIVSYMTMLWLVDNTFIYYFHLIVVLFVVWALREEGTLIDQRIPKIRSKIPRRLESLSPVFRKRHLRRPYTQDT